MQGLMMEQQLLIPHIIDHANRYHGDTQVVSVNTSGGEHRYNWAGVRARSLQLASALTRRGLEKSARIATIAWNNHRHLELYFGISGGGFVCHTINPRLFPEQLAYIINHAADQLLFFDKTFLPIVKGVRPHVPGVKAFILMEERDEALAASEPWIEYYEEFITDHDDNYNWPQDLDERDASSLCYTSGTTGNPKGVLYSHRSTLLHAMMASTPDVMNFSARDCLLPVVPMFHVNAWGTPYAVPIVGAKMVLPGPGLDGASLTRLFNEEGVTISAGVPTIWAGLLKHLDDTGTKLVTLNRTVVGGSACPPAMIKRFREAHGVEVLHAWGMTEMSPLGTVNNLKNKHFSLPEAEQEKLRNSQGRPPFLMELGIFDANGQPLPNDGEAQGDLHVRGPWVLSEYFSAEGDASPLVDGWFPTGDVATLDPDGFMVIRDRSKDIIKSGGEWISSVELENIMLGHPDIADAAVIAAVHEKWDERPLLIVVPHPGKTIDETLLLAWYDGKIAKWWTPDAVRVTDILPRNATGKVLKNRLRETFGNSLIK